MMPSVAVVVPSWNGAACLPACLASLDRQSYRQFRVVVVDNGSTDDSVALLRELRAPLTVELDIICNTKNLGFAGGVNRGIRHALAQDVAMVALLNNDAVADPGWLAALVIALREHPEAGIATSRLLMADGRTVDSTGDFLSAWGIAFPRDRDQPAEPVRPSGYVFAGSGGASLYRASLLRRIGMFDEEFFAYFEDVDLSFRAQLTGHRVWYCCDAVAYHRQGTTSRRIPGFTTRQTFANLPLLLLKNLPAALLPTVGARFALIYPLLLANAIRRGQGGPALAGAISALRIGARHALSERRRIQRARTVELDYLRDLLWPDLPPGMVVARAVRERARALLTTARALPTALRRPFRR